MRQYNLHKRSWNLNYNLIRKNANFTNLWILWSKGPLQGHRPTLCKTQARRPYQEGWTRSELEHPRSRKRNDGWRLSSSARDMFFAQELAQEPLRQQLAAAYYQHRPPRLLQDRTAHYLALLRRRCSYIYSEWEVESLIAYTKHGHICLVIIRRTISKHCRQNSGGKRAIGCKFSGWASGKLYPKWVYSELLIPTAIPAWTQIPGQ